MFGPKNIRFDGQGGAYALVNELGQEQIDRELASADASGNGNGRVEEDEVYNKQGMNAATYINFGKAINQARKAHFYEKSIEYRRQQVQRGTFFKAPLPTPLGKNQDNLSHLSRIQFVPFADALADRLAIADHYMNSFGPLRPIYYAEVTDLWREYSEHEFNAALSILTGREGGAEFALSRHTTGRIYLVQGYPDNVELDSELTGLDQICHSHPMGGRGGARPSFQDFQAIRIYDPDKTGAVVTSDGWYQRFSAQGSQNTNKPAYRLWRQ